MIHKEELPKEICEKLEKVVTSIVEMIKESLKYPEVKNHLKKNKN